MDISVNYVAILAAAVASMAVGFLWYGPILGKQWIKLKGYTKESLEKEKSKMGPYYGASFVIALLTAYVLTHIMTLSQNFYGYPPVQTGLTSAFFVWLGFVFPTQATGTIFGDKNMKLLAIDTGHQLTSLLIMGLVIGYLG